MKKIVLSAALITAAAFTANAQELFFTYNGEPLENGASITYDGFTADDYGMGSGYIEYKVDPGIHIVSDDTADVNITVKSNVQVNFCAGGQCITGTDLIKEDVELTENVPQNLELDYVQEVYDGSDIDIPVIELTVTAWYTYDEENVITLKVKMGGFNTPVEKLTVNGNNVNVVGKTLNYSLDGASNITLFSLSGKTLMNKAVSGNGSINLSNLPSGVYLYRVEGLKNKSGKFIIK